MLNKLERQTAKALAGKPKALAAALIEVAESLEVLAE